MPSIIGASSKELVNEKINGQCPVIDISVANSIESEPGTRCTFVGWEDDTDVTSSKLHRSLNVKACSREIFERQASQLPF